MNLKKNVALYEEIFYALATGIVSSRGGHFLRGMRMHRGLGIMDCSFGREVVVEVLHVSEKRLTVLMNPLSEMMRDVTIFCCMSKICLNSTWWRIQTSFFQQQRTCPSLTNCHSIS